MKKPLKFQVDIKSLMFGFIGALCLILLLGQENQQGTTGRYQCCAVNSDFTAVYITDTTTGQTWRMEPDENFDYGKPYERNFFDEELIKRYWEKPEGMLK